MKTNQKSVETSHRNFFKNISKLHKAIFALFIVTATAFTAAYAFNISAGSLARQIFGGAVEAAPNAPKNPAKTSFQRSDDKSPTNLASAALTNGTLTTARSGHTATRLDNGNVLIAGGDSGTFEVFNPTLNTSSGYGNLTTARARHTATRLADGRVLLTGGADANGAALSSTEIYDPSSNSFSAGAAMNAARAGQTATVLTNGNILIAGGDASGSAEIFDAASGTFTSLANSMTTPRAGHSAVLMNDGRVLIAGGEELNSAEIFNPADSSFTATGNQMAHHRAGATLRVLPDGKVQIIGGNDDLSMEVYDPSIDTIGAHAHLIPTNDEHDALMQFDILNAPTRAALFHAGQSDALIDRENHSITELGNQALVAGGTNTAGQTLNSLSILDSSSATVTTDKLDYSPGETAVISGTGWQAGETIDIILHEDPHTHTERRLTATADENGNFTANYLVERHDLNIKFIIGAKGRTSGKTAQTTFTDSPKIGSITPVNLIQNPDPVTQGFSATYSFTVNRGSGAGSSGAFTACLQVFNLPTGATGAFSSGSAGFVASEPNCSNGPAFNFAAATGSRSGTLTITTTSLTPSGISTFTLRAGTTTSTFSSPPPDYADNGDDLNVLAAQAATTLTVSPASGTYGGTVNLSATLTQTSGGAGVGGKTISFTLNGISVGSATTNASGVATLNAISLAGINAGTYNPPTNGVSASFAGDSGFLASSGSNSLTVNQKSLTPNITADNKIYDGNTSATILTRTFGAGEVVGMDDATLTGGTATFDTKHAGTGKTVTATGLTLSGAAAGNYVLSSTSAMTTADITAKPLTPTVTVNNKIYDGNTSATIATLSLASVIAPDAVTLSGGTANFTDKNVGTGKTVNITGLTLTGADAGNYSISGTATATADITARSLNVSATAQNKIYDGTTAATVSLSDDRVSGDVLSITYTSATFSDKNVGSGKTVTVNGIAVAGTDGGNYSLANTTANATADITARALTVSATGINKTYDGTPNATVTLTDDRVAGDALSTSYASASFADKNVGTGKAVSVSGITVGGADSGNYTFNTTAATTADITARTLVVSAAGVNKIYDGNASAMVTLSDDRVSGDSLIVSYTSASFNDKNAGNGKTVTVSGITVSGTDAMNYTFNATATTTADITALAITGNITADNKVYDGTTAATILTRTLSGQISGDDVSYDGGTANFFDKNVGSGKVVTATGLGLIGADAGNYTVNSTATANADITARPLTVSATGINKTYDGTTNASVTLSDNKVAGDDVTAAYTSASFNDKNVGTNKPVSVFGISISGADAGNYTFNATANTTADITARTLTVTATGVSKTYDGNATATVNLSSDQIAGDSLSLSYASASFDDKNVGMGKPVSIIGISVGGSDAGNYALGNTTASTNADITARTLTISAAAADKVYDGNTMASVSFSDDRVAGDVFSVSYTSATFDNRNAGNGKTVTVTGISISGTDAGNYSANNSATATADITALAITASIAADNKVYNGNNAAIFTCSLSGVIGTDDVSCTGGTATFANANVGTWLVTATGLGLTGADADNYTANATATDTADITKAYATIVVTPYNVTYDGAAHTADGTATGAGGENLNALLDLSGTMHTDAGDYTGDTWTFAGDGNHFASNGTVDDYIAKADANVVITGYTGVYDGAAHGATGSATGVGGVDLSAGLNLGASFTNVPGGTANWTFSGGTNYNDESGTAAIVINKADATCSISGYNGVYDGAAHGASGSCTGVLNEALSGLNLGATFTNVPGGTANWTFTDATGNYNDTSGNAAINISKANAFITVTPYSVVYDANSHTATGTAVGVESPTPADLSGLLDLSGTTHTDAGIYNGDVWTFAGNGNYNSASGTVDNNIAKAPSATVVTCTPNVTYTGSALTPCSAAVTGVGGLNQSLTVSYSNNVNAGLANASASYAGDANHDSSSDSETFTIDPASSTTVVTCPSSVVYNGSAQTPCTVSVTGAGGLNLTPTANYTANVNVGTVTASYTFAGDSNHTGSSNSKNFDITQAPVTATAGGGSATYDGATKSPSACVVSGAYTGDLICVNSPASVGPNAGTTPVSPVVSGTGLSNFAITAVNGSYTINKAPTTTVVTFEAGPYVYRASAFTATAQVTGAGGLSSSVAVSYSGDCRNVTAANGCTAAATYAESANYLSSTDSKSITITPKAATWMTNNNGKIYGSPDPNPLTTGTGSGFFAVDNVTAAYSRTLGEAVGSYSITATLNSVNPLANYAITNAGATFTIGAWTLNGFYSPVGVQNTYTIPAPTNFVWNTIKGGQTVPLKFNVFAGSVEQTSTGIISFTSQEITCSTTFTTVEDPIEIVTTGGTVLRYSGTPGVDGQYIQNWQTPNSPNRCYRVRMMTLDGSNLYAFFKTKK